MTTPKHPVLLIALTTVLLVACGDEKKADADAATPAASASAARPALSVTATRLQSATLPQTLSANGSVAAWQEAIVGAEINGLRLAEVRVNVGDAVKRGQVLATFAPATVQA